jgi:hypothetical protein
MSNIDNIIFFETFELPFIPYFEDESVSIVSLLQFIVPEIFPRGSKSNVDLRGSFLSLERNGVLQSQGEILNFIRSNPLIKGDRIDFIRDGSNYTVRIPIQNSIQSLSILLNEKR